MKPAMPLTKAVMLAILCRVLILPAGAASAAPLVIDHRSTDITRIPQSAIEQAAADLHIAYGHTSHGTQLVTGMRGLVTFANGGGLGLALPVDIFEFNSGGTGGALDLRDTPFAGAEDLGNPDWTAWAEATRDYLDANADVNVVIWSWCGQVSIATENDINTYLRLMSELERDYPAVKFVYMTGHLDGTGQTGNLNVRNRQIRDYCTANDKILYDFADIESYDPDAETYYMPLLANDACLYDSDGDGTLDDDLDANWAVAWQDRHTLDVDWYECKSAHSQPLNANRKAYAAWWLWAELAGWKAEETVTIPATDPADGDSGDSGCFVAASVR